MSLLARITVNPRQCGGRPCIRGMRIRVSDVLDLLQSGLSPAQVVAELPDLELEYIQRMMAWLLWRPQHEMAEGRIVQLGLGAGALTRFTRNRLPQAHTTVVEASTRVIETCRRWFRLPANDSRLQVLHDDAERFLASAERGVFNVIQCDLYDAQARGPVVDSIAFYRQCFAALDDPGVLVVNLFGSSRPAYERSAARIAQAFEGRVLDMPQTLAGNIVLLAFRGPAFAMRWTALEARARVLEASTGLDASHWVRGLRRRAPQGASLLKVGARSA